MDQKVFYGAVVLDERSREVLKETFGHLLPPGWQWICHHMTICLGPINDPTIRKSIGETKQLNVVGVGRSEKALALKVSGYHSNNTIPHITLGVNTQGGGKPKDSNAIVQWGPYPEILIVTGSVMEVL